MKTKEELNALKEKSEDQKWKKVRKLTDEELEKVSGGEITSANVVGYGSSDPAFDKSLECMFGAPAIIK